MAKSSDYLFQKWAGSFSVHERRVASSFGEDDTTANPILTRNLPLYSMENSELPAGQVQVLASFIPDLVLNSGPAVSSSKDINPFLAVLLCADISGFTALSETLAKSGDEGAYKLTALINKILGNLVSVIYENGGDVWKFSGDAFLAFWKVGINDNYAAVLHRAVFCALQIQKKYGKYETEFKSILRVKIGMSAGCVIWCMVGYNLSKRTILVGSPINEQINAQRKCSSGDVIITASMWSHFNPLYCVFEELDDGKFIKISHMVGYLGLVSPKEISLHLGRNMKKQLDQKVRRFSELEHGGVRNANLLLCMMSPVIQQMQADLKLDYLTEQRTLTIMFINLLPRKMLTTDLIALVDGAYKIIHKFTMKAGGILDKVSLFDKDVMFVVIFGKNGYVNELRATASLFCGYDIREACIALNGANKVSVGIASGVCYCGVVGHPQRQEWTVIGSTVNKAARLMTAYVGQITCDRATRDDAELPAYYFTELKTVPLKGFSNKETFYKFVADKGLNFKNSVRDGLLPLLGREDEMTEFRRSLDDLSNGCNARKGLLIIGEPKIGKSRLLDEMIIEAIDRGLDPVVVGLRLGHSILAYTGAVHFLCHVFHINKENVEMDLKRLLNVLLIDHIDLTDLIHIDELFDTNQKNTVPTEGLKRLFLLAIQMGIKSSVIVIDDVHFCDGPSRELFCSLVESGLKFLIFTQDSRSNPFENLQTITLKPMADNSIPALVCQFMNVQAVQEDIIGFLTMGELAHAGFCQTQLKALLENGFIEIIDASPDTAQDFDMIFPDSQLLKRFLVRVPSLEKLPPPRDYFDHQWPSDDEFQYRDHLHILAVLGSHVKRQRATSYSGKRLLRQRLRFKSLPQLANSVRNILKYNANPAFAEEDMELIGCFSQLNDDILRIYPRDVSISNVIIDESVNLFQKIRKISTENNSFASEEEKKTTESENSELIDEQSGPRGKTFIPKKSITTQKSLHSVKKESLIKAIVRVPEMDLNDCAISQSYVSFITIFDSLRPFEQLILKCSSVIGSVFQRPMLDSLLRNNNHLFISRTIAHLFELNILTCSLSGDGQECVCQDANADLTNFSIHKSGFCEHPCFQHPPLCDVVYEMIPPNVKKMFHERAIEYLTSKAIRRCSSCLLELEKYPYLTSLSRHDVESEKKFAYDEKLKLFLETMSKMPLLNFLNCTCIHTENDTYRQIIQHCDKTGLKETSLKYKVNYAGLKISLDQFAEAELILDDVENEIKSVLLPRKEEKLLHQELKYLMAKICFETGELDSALGHLFEILSPSVKFALGRLFLRNFLFNGKNMHRSRIAIQSLNLITRIYIMQKNWEAARHVNKIATKMLQHFQAPYELCKAYTYSVDIALSQHGLRFPSNFENGRIISAAFGLLPTSHASVAVLLGRILTALYLIRSMGVGDLSSGYALLKSLVRISSTVKLPPAPEYLLLEEIYLLVMMGNLGDAHAAIINLGKFDKLLYHAICLDFLRATGFWIEPPEDSRDFLVETLGSRDGTMDPSAFHRATLSLVLWMFWTNPPKVLDVCALVNLPSSPRPVHCVADCFVRLMELELLIMEELFVPDHVTPRPEMLRHWMTEIKIMAQNFQIMLPPFLLIHAYKVHRLAKNRSQTRQILKEAEQVAKKQQNELYVQRIAVCLKDWCSVGENSDLDGQQDLPGHAFVEWPCSNWSDFILRYP